jgi:hypothetical protein
MRGMAKVDVYLWRLQVHQGLPAELLGRGRVQRRAVGVAGGAVRAAGGRRPLSAAAALSPPLCFPPKLIKTASDQREKQFLSAFCDTRTRTQLQTHHDAHTRISNTK